MSTKEEVIRLVEGLSESDLQVVKRMLEGLTKPGEEEHPAPAVSSDDQRERVRAIRGVLAHTHTSVDEFLARKREEVELEEERYRRRHQEAA